MKISISRQNLYLLVLSVILLIFVLFFSFLVLIPKGKEYRQKRTEIKKELTKLKVHHKLPANLHWHRSNNPKMHLCV